MTLHAQQDFAVIEGTEAQAQWSALLDRCFPVPAGRHFLEDFPLWDEALTKALSGRVIQRLGLWQSKKLIAAAGCCTAALRWTGGSAGETKEIPVALLGAVATELAYRGQGLATQIVQRLMQWAEQQGAWAVFLWGSEHEFYRRLGFELRGSQVQIPLAWMRQEEVASQDWVFQEGWSPSLGQCLLTSRQNGLQLRAEDLPWIAAHRGIRWFWAAAKHSPQEVIAYAAYGKGIDLEGFVHEWGGEPQALLALFQTITERAPQARLLTNPVLFEKFRVKFKFFGTAAVDEGIPREFLCLAKILKPKEWEAKWGTSEFPPGLWLGGLDSV